MRVNVSIDGIDQVARALEALPAELEKQGGTAVRASVRAGAAIVLEAMKRNVQRIIDAPNKDGRFVSTGLLMQSLSIRRQRRRKAGGERGEGYVVGPRNRVYPNGVRVQAVGAMLEYGAEKRAPMPWAEPAYQETRDEALRAIVSTAQDRLQRLLDRYARMSRAR